MIPYQKEKLENAICFFASAHRKRTRAFLHQTFLYKYLALFDFGYLKKYGELPLELTYRAMERGPVPLEVYNRRADTDWSELFSFRQETVNADGNICYVVIPSSKKGPDMDYFSQREVKLMNVLIEIYAENYVTSKLMSDVSHAEILAWKRTWKTKQNGIIDYALEFPGDINQKKEPDLKFPEEVYLTQKGLENCG